MLSSLDQPCHGDYMYEVETTGGYTHLSLAHCRHPAEQRGRLFNIITTAEVPR